MEGNENFFRALNEDIDPKKETLSDEHKESLSGLSPTEKWRFLEQVHNVPEEVVDALSRPLGQEVGPTAIESKASHESIIENLSDEDREELGDYINENQRSIEDEVLGRLKEKKEQEDKEFYFQAAKRDLADQMAIEEARIDPNVKGKLDRLVSLKPGDPDYIIAQDEYRSALNEYRASRIEKLTGMLTNGMVRTYIEERERRIQEYLKRGNPGQSGI